MPQQAIEIILTRQLASYLAMPILLFDAGGTLLYYNEPAEAILGQRFDETGEMQLDEWYRVFRLTAEDGSAVPFEARPLFLALHKQQPSHRTWRLQTCDGRVKKVAGTAFPLEGQGARHLGALVVFWEAE